MLEETPQLNSAQQFDGIESNKSSVPYHYGEPIPVPLVDTNLMSMEEGNLTYFTLEQGYASAQFMSALQSVLSAGRGENVRAIAVWHPSGVWGWSATSSSEHDMIKKAILQQIGDDVNKFTREPFIDFQLQNPSVEDFGSSPLTVTCRGATPAHVETFGNVLNFLSQGPVGLDKVTSRVRCYPPGNPFESEGKLSDAQVRFRQWSPSVSNNHTV